MAEGNTFKFQTFMCTPQHVQRQRRADSDRRLSSASSDTSTKGMRDSVAHKDCSTDSGRELSSQVFQCNKFSAIGIAIVPGAMSARYRPKRMKLYLRKSAHVLTLYLSILAHTVLCCTAQCESGVDDKHNQGFPWTNPLRLRTYQGVGP